MLKLRIGTFIGVLQICILFSFFSPASLLAQKSPKKIFSSFHNWEGLWHLKSEKLPRYEEWVWKNDTLMEGRAYQVQGNDTLILENLLLLREKNTILYMAEPIGQNRGLPISFKLTSYQKNKEWVFENLAHDFPTRILYRQNEPKIMEAEVSGKDQPALTFVFHKK